MIKKTILATALAAVAIGSAQANTVYIGGSSAFRKTAAAALAGAGWSYVANDGSSLTDVGGTHVLYSKNGDYISTCWSGSEAGVQSVCAGTNSRALGFFATNATGNVKAFASDGKTVTNNAIPTIVTNADAAFSDCSATISRWNGLKNSKELINGLSVVVNYVKPSLSTNVGVQSFTFLASENFPTNKATSISANAAKVLFEKGQIPLSLITGDSNDATATIWLTGRNPDSGTRITAFNETGYGALKATMNYKVTKTDTNAKTITELTLYPTNVINGLVTAPGDDGQSSGGTLVGSIAPLDAKLVVYGPATNTVISVVYTNFTATNIFTNTVKGTSASVNGGVYNGALSTSPVAPATAAVVTTNAAGSATAYASYKYVYYYIATNLYTNVTPPTIAGTLAGTNGKSTNLVAFPVTVPSSSNYLVTYASVGDAITKSTLSSNYPVLLNYNGDGIQGSSIADTNAQATAKSLIKSKIMNGSYTFWNYEYALLSTNAQAGASSVFNAIVTATVPTVAAPNAKVSDLNVTRADGGATIYNK